MEKFDFWRWKKDEAGFVIAVLLVIVVVSGWQIRVGAMKTRDAQRRADVEQVARALAHYYSDHEAYPNSVDGKIVACGEDAQEGCEWGEGPVKDSDEVVYIKQLPIDPLSSKGWSYRYISGSDGFKIYVGQEYHKDPSFKPSLTEVCGKNVQCSWYVEKKF